MNEGEENKVAAGISLGRNRLPVHILPLFNCRKQLNNGMVAIAINQCRHPAVVEKVTISDSKMRGLAPLSLSPHTKATRCLDYFSSSQHSHRPSLITNSNMSQQSSTE